MTQRKDLMLSEKLKIIEMIEKEGKTVKECAGLFKCGRTQIYSIIKRKEELIEDYEHGKQNLKSMRRGPDNHAIVNDGAFEWFIQCRNKDVPISGPMLQAKAKEIAEVNGWTNFKASNGWLSSFRKRYDIICKTVVKDSNGVNAEVIDESDVQHSPGDINNTGGNDVSSGGQSFKTLCWSGFSNEGFNRVEGAGSERSCLAEAMPIEGDAQILEDLFVLGETATSQSHGTSYEGDTEPDGMECSSVGPTRKRPLVDHETASSNDNSSKSGILDDLQCSPKRVNKTTGYGAAAEGQTSCSWFPKEDLKPKERNDLLLSEKVRIIELIENEGKSVRECVDLFKCGKTQIYNILRRKNELLEDFEFGKQNLKRMGRRPNDLNVAIDEETFEWFISSRMDHIPLTGPTIQAKAKEIAVSKGLLDFKASNGWLGSFRRRHGIICKTVVRESNDENADVFDEFNLHQSIGGISDVNLRDHSSGGPPLKTLCWSGFYKEGFSRDEDDLYGRHILDQEYLPWGQEDGTNTDDDDAEIGEHIDHPTQGGLTVDERTLASQECCFVETAGESHGKVSECDIVDDVVGVNVGIVDDQKCQFDIPKQTHETDRCGIASVSPPPSMFSSYPKSSVERSATKDEVKNTSSHSERGIRLGKANERRRINTLAEGAVMLQDLERLIESNGIIELREEITKFRKSFEQQLKKYDSSSDPTQRKITDYFQ